jgi:hypothetical protein
MQHELMIFFSNVIAGAAVFGLLFVLVIVAGRLYGRYRGEKFSWGDTIFEGLIIVIVVALVITVCYLTGSLILP